MVISDAPGFSGAGASATATTNVGAVTAINLTAAGSGYITPGGIKKFVDPLPGLCNPAVPGSCPATGKYIPLAVPEAKMYAGVQADEYEIGLVQYRTSFSSSLPPTLVRGYVQLKACTGTPSDIVLANAMLTGPDVPIPGRCGVTPPQWLGPTILATKDKPVRIIFRNLLPTGSGGDLFLPTDSTLMGSGMGPTAMWNPQDLGTVIDGARNPNCTQYPKPDECFKDNRATLHLHGGISPWISDGTPHQWITPANRTDTLAPGRQCVERARHGSGPMRWYNRRLHDVLLHQPAERAPDVLPRPCLGHHPPQRVRGRGCGLRDLRRHREGADGRSPCQRRSRYPAGDPGPDLRAEGHATLQPVRRGRQRHELRSGPDLGRQPLGRLRQLLVPSRVHAGAEPRRPWRHERLRALDVRALVLASGWSHDIRADRQPVLRQGPEGTGRKTGYA